MQDNLTTSSRLKAQEGDLKPLRKFYSTEHVSRVFHKYLRVGLPKFINDLRLDYIENELMLSDKKKITDLIFEAGFKSVQSYYRSKSLHE